jgi:hypothetical protein
VLRRDDPALTSGLSCNHVGARSTDRDSLRLLSNLPGNDAYLWTFRTVQGGESSLHLWSP